MSNTKNHHGSRITHRKDIFFIGLKRLMLGGIKSLKTIIESMFFLLFKENENYEHSHNIGISTNSSSELKKVEFFFIENFLDITQKDFLINSFHFRSDHIVQEADRICEHIFNLLGSGLVEIGNPIEWHADFISGYRWNPKKYFKSIKPSPYPGKYDIKVPWELSRCQHFIRLGQAYWISKNEKYAMEFVSQVEDWISNNPWPWGVNWTCTMDVAIRAVNWLWGYGFFSESSNLSDEFKLDLHKSLLVHGRHIWNNLENKGEFTSNHYISNLVGLIYLGILCPEFKEAQVWREFGISELEKEMFKQVYSDGVNFEGSVCYHRLTTELFISAVILAKKNGINFNSLFMERLELMLEFIMHITKPNGTVPIIGDNDNGRVHRFSIWEIPANEWIDHRYLLAIGAVIFDRFDFGQAAGDKWEEAIWLLGKDAIYFRKEMETRTLPKQFLDSHAFPVGGLYILRNKDIYTVVDIGPVGQSGFGGHAHNDSLSFELFAFGQSWIVDPGTFVYTKNYELRNLFRSTAYHNTAVINGNEQNIFSNRNLFFMMSGGDTNVLQWQNNRDTSRFLAEFSGKNGISHQREFLLNNENNTLIINDNSFGTKLLKSMDLYINFAPDLSVEKKLDGCGLIVKNKNIGKTLLVSWSNQIARSLLIGDRQYAFGYGNISTGKFIEIKASGDNFSMHFSFID